MGLLTVCPIIALAIAGINFGAIIDTIIVLIFLVAFVVLLLPGLFLTGFFIGLFGFFPYKYKEESARANGIIVGIISSVENSPEGLERRKTMILIAKSFGFLRFYGN